MSTVPARLSDRGKRGTTVYQRNHVQAGVNVYCSEASPSIELLDMMGKPLHHIDLPKWCKLVKPHDDGFILLHNRLSLLRFDGSSVWDTTEDRYHHDFDVVGDQILTLDEMPSTLEHEGQALDFIDNGIAYVDLQSGKQVLRRSLDPVLRRFVTTAAMERLVRATKNGKRLKVASDLYHVNTLSVMKTDTKNWKAGDILFAARHLDLIGVIDAKKWRVRWHYAEGLEGPHHPQVTPTGTLLLFDNGRHRNWSRIIELDPDSREVVWSYDIDDDPTFFSETRGSVQLLPNGNLLVAESDRGRWFEITRDKKVVWEHFTKDAFDEVADGTHMLNTTYRTMRLFPDDIDAPAFRDMVRLSARSPASGS